MTRLDRSLISGLPLFQSIAGTDLDFILQHARSSRAAKDSVIFEQDEEAHFFYLLLDGHVRVVITARPDSRSLRVISGLARFSV